MFKPSFQLNTGKHIGPGHPTYIIAEIGSNHDGSLEKAKFLVEQAAQAGADAVKIQSFQVHTLINRRNKNGAHWQDHPAWDLLDKLTVPAEWHAALATHAKQCGIDFCSAPFDLERLALLDALDVPFIKIASGDLTYHALLQAAAKTGRPIVLATGMSTLQEVEAAVSVIQQAGGEQLALLHCVSLYPPQFQDANVKAVSTLKAHFPVPVGYSDHTPGSVVPVAAVSLGACVIEKHMTDDRANVGPDHPYALTVAEFKQLVQDIRHVEAALGDGEKKPPANEVPERVVGRRAMYAQTDLKKGSVLEPTMVQLLRHAYPEGILAEEAESAMGKPLQCDVPAYTLMTWEMLAQ